ncbi:GNAT family N-acetyltransferase [Actinoplanes sp. LDG1-06]|uniref:GNAT family N-acetyltransferase n=1 Tax=Paractinoplanes ovalisporus TaxID=2810368 RepID=A0ABS2A3T8_9ACTN|nr:GNAT family N-acetyltransferase [Actinoplanes ovalisporus]MBM2614360.1 GNAT family N-acetyltransferase [Actinoplanes ovalisporus]
MNPERAEALVSPLMLEYLAWLGDRITEEFGVVFDDSEAVVAAHHQEFMRELPQLLGPRGRLLVARGKSVVAHDKSDVTGDKKEVDRDENEEIIGIGVLKPVDAETAEIKRMYVRPEGRGLGIGRAILERLLADAATVGYTTARLETATFMREAHALYRSVGFQDRAIFENTEAGMSGLDAYMIHMEVKIPSKAPGATASEARPDPRAR